MSKINFNSFTILMAGPSYHSIVKRVALKPLPEKEVNEYFLINIWTQPPKRKNVTII